MSTRSLRDGCRAALAFAALTLCTLCHAAPFLYVANAGSDSISVVDVATNTVVRTFTAGVFPTSVALNPTSVRGYVTNNVDDTVSVFDSSSVYATVPVAPGPNAVAVNAAGTRAYVSNDFNTLTVMDAIASTVIATVPVGTCASGLAVHPSGSVVYVATCTPQQLYVVDAFSNTVTATVPLPFDTADIAVNPAGTRLYTSSPSTPMITVIETGTFVTTTFAIPDIAAGLALNPAGTRLYVALDAINTVAVIDTGTNTVLAMIPVGSTPVKIAVDATGTRAYVANATSDSISVVNLGNNTVEATIPVGSLPLWVAISAAPPPLVTSYTAQAATGNGLINVQLSGGGPTCSLLEPRFIGPPPGSAPIPPTTVGGITFPYGLFDFRTQGCIAGSTITLSITYPGPIDRAEYWKYGPTPGNTAPHWYVLPAQINGNVATISITDGGLGDDDLVPNGVVVDQGGPGIGIAPIPALSHWMLALLGFLMLLVPVAQAQIYKWVDEKGQTHYEERPPEGKDPRDAKKMTAPAAPKGAAKSGGGDDWKQRELEFKQRQTERAQADSADEKKRAQREAACAKAREKLEYESQGGRFYTTDEKGERQYRSDAEQAAVVESARRRVQDLCN